MHLLAAVGAVAGWEVPVIAFFSAPFLGLAWALISTGAQKLLNRQVKVIPYGPHLAAAALVVVAFREPLVTYFGRALLG
jgi:prepilin signal peptidase PulO-like enzyme (type II secretory pathway)